MVARKVEWIRNACLAAVLLFPAVAALHGIVLAVLHVEGKSAQPIHVGLLVSNCLPPPNDELI